MTCTTCGDDTCNGFHAELRTSKKQFARGAIRAEISPCGDERVRIEGPVTTSKGRQGLSMHLNTARALGEWLLSVTGPAVETKARPRHWHCDTHGDFDAYVAVGCPECVRELRHDLARSMANHVADLNSPSSESPTPQAVAKLKRAEWKLGFMFAVELWESSSYDTLQELAAGFRKAIDEQPLKASAPLCSCGHDGRPGPGHQMNCPQYRERAENGNEGGNER